jgi:phosphoglucomutase
MKKENLIAQLEGAKALSSQVDIDKVIALLDQLEPEIVVETKLGITVDLAEEIANKIERSLDYNSDEFVDTDSAEFELDWNNVIRLNRVDVYVDNIMEHVTATLDGFVVEAPAEEDTDRDNEIAPEEELQQIQQWADEEEGRLLDIDDIKE